MAGYFALRESFGSPGLPGRSEPAGSTESSCDRNVCAPVPGLVTALGERGSQYAARVYREKLVQHSLLASMSRKGDCWGNAVMERFFGSLKSEWTDSQRYLTRAQARRDVVEYIEMHYNSDRFTGTHASPWLANANFDAHAERAATNRAHPTAGP